MDEAGLNDLRIEVQRIGAENDAALKRIAQIAPPGIDVGQILMVRIVALIEATLGDMNSVRRLEFELALQRNYARMIADVESQAARAKLLQGVQLGNGGRPAG